MRAAAAIVLALAPSAALAGPMGSGLAHTEAMAKRPKLVIRHADAACLGEAARVVGQWPGVQNVRVADGALRLTFGSKAHATAAEPGVRSTVRSACAGTSRADAEPAPAEAAPDQGA